MDVNGLLNTKKCFTQYQTGVKGNKRITDNIARLAIYIPLAFSKNQQEIGVFLDITIGYNYVNIPI